MNWKWTSFLFLAVLAAGSAQAQTSDLVDVTGTFAGNAPLSLYSSPGGTFSADITVPSTLTYNSSSTFDFNGDFSAFRYHLNGGAPIVVDHPFAFVDTSETEATGTTFLDIQDGFRLTAATSIPSFFTGSIESGGSLIPGTYALSDASMVGFDSSFAQITSGKLTVSPVPEPSTLALLGGGAAVAAAATFLGRHRRTPLGPSGDGLT